MAVTIKLDYLVLSVQNVNQIIQVLFIIHPSSSDNRKC